MEAKSTKNATRKPNLYRVFPRSEARASNIENIQQLVVRSEKTEIKEKGKRGKHIEINNGGKNVATAGDYRSFPRTFFFSERAAPADKYQRVHPSLEPFAAIS